MGADSYFNLLPAPQPVIASLLLRLYSASTGTGRHRNRRCLANQHSGGPANLPGDLTGEGIDSCAKHVAQDEKAEHSPGYVALEFSGRLCGSGVQNSGCVDVVVR